VVLSLPTNKNEYHTKRHAGHNKILHKYMEQQKANKRQRRR